MPGRTGPRGTIERMAGFFAGVIAGVALVGLILIVLTPSRRVRADARLDREIETRLLLGVDPDARDSSLEPAPEQREHSDFGAKELQELRSIGVEKSSGRRGGRRP
jgi:hypothetical protein